MRKIAILGAAESTRDLAPFDDPSWEIWGLAWRALHHPRMERCFEIHQIADFRECVGPDYEEWLADPVTKAGVPDVYVLPEVAAEIAGTKPYPFDRAAALMGGRTYFTSSFSYMLAMAIDEGATEIGVWGVDLTDGSEYTHQRPCAEFLLGIAHGRGIKLSIPPQSALLKQAWVYGREDEPPANPLIAQWERKAAEYRAQAKQVLIDLPQQIAALEGAAHEADEIVKDLLNQSRGG